MCNCNMFFFQSSFTDRRLLLYPHLVLLLHNVRTGLALKYARTIASTVNTFILTLDFFSAFGTCKVGQVVGATAHMEKTTTYPYPCKFWARGRCRHGDACKFLHTPFTASTDHGHGIGFTTSTTSTEYAPIRCRFFNSTGCMKGNMCTYLHDGPAPFAYVIAFLRSFVFRVRFVAFCLLGGSELCVPTPVTFFVMFPVTFSDSNF